MFDRALASVGLDWRAGALWLKAIEFERSQASNEGVLALYERAVGIANADIGADLLDFCCCFDFALVGCEWFDFSLESQRCSEMIKPECSVSE